MTDCAITPPSTDPALGAPTREEEKAFNDYISAFVKRIPPPSPATAQETADEIARLNLLRLCDHFGVLEARIRFYTKGAEDIAEEADEHDCLVRASMDLLGFVSDFGELLDMAHCGKQVPAEGAFWDRVAEDEEEAVEPEKVAA